MKSMRSFFGILVAQAGQEKYSTKHQSTPDSNAQGIKDRGGECLSPKEMTAQPAEVLQHELLMHKIELKMQNEELHRRKSPPPRIVTLSAIAVTA